MHYRKLGNTGLEVSRLGFGAMRLPTEGIADQLRVNRELAIPMIHYAFEHGVNYIDTAVGYCNEDSQRAVGEALKGWRHNIVLSTKNHYYGDDESVWRGHLENSLDRLQVDHIDIYNHHGINWKSYRENVEPRLNKWMAKARDEGLIKHICCSFHDDNDALMKLIDSGYPEVITLQYNLLDRALEEGISYAGECGIGVVVMGPVAGGRLGVPSDVLNAMVEGVHRIPELALRFVLANPDVTVALSGMSTMQQVQENVKVANDNVSLTNEEKQTIDDHLKRLAKMRDLYCTGCGYCLPCPVHVDIPGIFAQYNLGRVYGLWPAAKGAYQKILAQGHGADACTECGQCEEKCPQHLSIRKDLQKAHIALTDQS